VSSVVHSGRSQSVRGGPLRLTRVEWGEGLSLLSGDLPKIWSAAGHADGSRGDVVDLFQWLGSDAVVRAAHRTGIRLLYGTVCHPQTLGKVERFHHQPSPRRYAEQVKDWEYPRGSDVRRLNSQGMLTDQGHRWFVCGALANQRVRVEPFDGKLLVSYRHMYIREVDVERRCSRPLVVARDRRAENAAGRPTGSLRVLRARNTTGIECRTVKDVLATGVKDVVALYTEDPALHLNLEPNQEPRGHRSECGKRRVVPQERKSPCDDCEVCTSAAKADLFCKLYVAARQTNGGSSTEAATCKPAFGGQASSSCTRL